MNNTPFIHDPGRLLPSTAILSINEVCKTIDRDNHCRLAMHQIGKYITKHKREYALYHLEFMIEYFKRNVTLGGS